MLISLISEFADVNNFFGIVLPWCCLKLSNLYDDPEFERLSKELHQIEDNLHRLKVRINNRVIEHRKYFFEILKKGIDVRKDGLSWCLVRLIELKSFIEISKFPKFLLLWN